MDILNTIAIFQAITQKNRNAFNEELNMPMKNELMLPVRVFFTLLITLLLSPLAHAGCSETKAVGWVADSQTGQMIENLGSGTVVECGNMDGAFGGFQTPNFYAGHATCSQNCDKGFKPRVTYVKVGEKWTPGKAIFGENATCVQQKGSNRKYCWNG